MVAIGEGEVIGSVEARRAPMDLHPGATYLHRGRAYEVEDLNLAAHNALVRRVPNRYYTRVKVDTDVEILEESRTRSSERRDIALGSGADDGRGQLLQKDTGPGLREIGVFPLDLPPTTFETRGLWVTLPPLPPPEGNTRRTSPSS
jgi:DEAD/DEAH box helicase domain-containing protein